MTNAEYMMAGCPVTSKSTLMIPIKFSAYGVNLDSRMVDKILDDCVISGFRRKIDENCALLGYCAAISGNFLPTFRDKLSGPSSGVKNSKELFLVSFLYVVKKSDLSVQKLQSALSPLL